MVLKKVKEIPSKDLLLLTVFLNLPKGKNLMDLLNKFISTKITKYKYLYDIANSNDVNNTPDVMINVEEDYEQMMFDAYDIYYNIKDILSDAHKEYKNIESLNLMWDFIPTYEKYLSISKFSLAKTKTIQKMFFENLIKREIEKENYEYCAEIQKTIKNL